MKTKKIYTHNGVEYTYRPEYRKWEFKAERPNNGQKFILITTVGEGNKPFERAKRIAGIVSGSLKRGFASAQDSLDELARGQIRKIVSV